jgi:hypothetical protein
LTQLTDRITVRTIDHPEGQSLALSSSLSHSNGKLLGGQSSREDTWISTPSDQNEVEFLDIPASIVPAGKTVDSSLVDSTTTEVFSAGSAFILL